jgi:hypothetical protein
MEPLNRGGYVGVTEAGRSSGLVILRHSPLRPNASDPEMYNAFLLQHCWMLLF